MAMSVGERIRRHGATFGYDAQLFVVVVATVILTELISNNAAAALIFDRDRERSAGGRRSARVCERGRGLQLVLDADRHSARTRWC